MGRKTRRYEPGRAITLLGTTKACGLARVTGCTERTQESQLICPDEWRGLPARLQFAWNDARRSGDEAAMASARAAIENYASRYLRREEAPCS